MNCSKFVPYESVDRVIDMAIISMIVPTKCFMYMKLFEKKYVI